MTREEAKRRVQNLAAHGRIPPGTEDAVVAELMARKPTPTAAAPKPVKPPTIPYIDLTEDVEALRAVRAHLEHARDDGGTGLFDARPGNLHASGQTATAAAQTAGGATLDADLTGEQATEISDTGWFARYGQGTWTRRHGSLASS